MNPEQAKMLFRVVKERLNKNRAERRRTAAKLNIPWKVYRDFEENIKKQQEELPNEVA